ncbi:helix-turn-helix domain-containing protein [Actinokineospora enzanensis]|uniref:helix-turn-helix domain-containing protein n=1 Tax=Actinokineospora enzanensis TaxID=155975 RepID=UPI00039FFED7|nr:helix-turn-helix transcriptional regulator [Actinokineospora enzanensis]
MGKPGLRLVSGGAQVAPARGAEPLWRNVLGGHLRQLRHARRETLGDTATRAGVSPQYLSEVERGLKEPSSEMIAAITGALGVTLADLTLDIAERLRSGGGRGPTCRASLSLAA